MPLSDPPPVDIATLIPLDELVPPADNIMSLEAAELAYIQKAAVPSLPSTFPTRSLARDSRSNPPSKSTPTGSIVPPPALPAAACNIFFLVAIIYAPYANACPAVKPYHVVPPSRVVNTNTSTALAVAVNVGAVADGKSIDAGHVTLKPVAETS
jgi:hypothetical protein